MTRKDLGVTPAASADVTRKSDLDDGLATKQATGNYITALTSDVTASGPGSAAATIANDAVTNAKLANMNPATFKGRTSGSAGDPVDLSAAQVRAILDLADSGWVTVGGGGGAPAFTNGWGNLGGGHQGAQFKKVGNQVFLRGMVGGGTFTASVFTLPAGYRPPATYALTVLIQNATTNNASAGTAHTHTINHSACFFQVNTDGTLGNVSGHITAGYLSLNNISFWVD